MSNVRRDAVKQSAAVDLITRFRKERANSSVSLQTQPLVH